MTLDLIGLLGDRNVLALTIDGEAEGEPIEGIVAVGSVIRNRLRMNPDRFGASFTQVCLRASDRGTFQFSCWTPAGGANDHARIMERATAIEDGQTPGDPWFRQCLFVASGIISGELLDNTNGSTHYVTSALAASPSAPAWVKQAIVKAKRGDQVFMVA